MLKIWNKDDKYVSFRASDIPIVWIRIQIKECLYALNRFQNQLRIWCDASMIPLTSKSLFRHFLEEWTLLILEILL